MIEVRPIADATLGARVSGVDLRKLDDATFGEIEAAWHEHGVLVFEGQFLSDEEQIAFSRRFGSLERLIVGGAPDPEIAYLSNVRPDGRLIAPEGSYALFLLGNTFWHTDSSFKRVPAKASILSARRVPQDGGETEWADMRAAYDALDAETRARADGAVAVHSYRYSQGRIGGVDVLSDAEWDALPPVEHALVRVHPATGRPNLYAGRHASHIVGMDEEQGRALLEKLTADAVQAPRVFAHHWSEGDLVIWDNRCVLHRGRTWPGDQARVMSRTTIAGDDAGNEWSL
ncbi:MAG: TauD/TfdA family dioxygenase [Deltaproteobacteria bacterium]|nr:TauD/TfdA family dioxygenase [Deltaproteobacteria bacterium]MBW2416429.1 TauD/TfdA family dioxygenase [Deltaproteobacteria bacterium]